MSTIFDLINSDSSIEDITTFIITNPSCVNSIENETNNRPLMSASIKKRLDVCQVLFKNGSIIDLGNSAGFTALMCAVSVNNIPIATFLITNGANVNLYCDEITCLIRCATFGYYDMCVLLLANGANKDYQTSQGYKAIYWAQQGKFTDIVALLS